MMHKNIPLGDILFVFHILIKTAQEESRDAVIHLSNY